MLTLRIESASRWDALALTRKLARYHWFLVEPDPRRWDVYVVLDGEAREVPPRELRKPLLDWLNERRLERATIHSESADFVLRRG